MNLTISQKLALLFCIQQRLKEIANTITGLEGVTDKQKYVDYFNLEIGQLKELQEILKP
jgi:hypothetical protein